MCLSLSLSLSLSVCLSLSLSLCLSLSISMCLSLSSVGRQVISDEVSDVYVLLSEELDMKIVTESDHIFYIWV